MVTGSYISALGLDRHCKLQGKLEMQNQSLCDGKSHGICLLETPIQGDMTTNDRAGYLCFSLFGGSPF